MQIQCYHYKHIANTRICRQVFSTENKDIYCQSADRRLFIDAVNESRHTPGISF